MTNCRGRGRGQGNASARTQHQHNPLLYAELALANLPEDQKRLIFRSLMSTYNVRLAEAAKQAGVIEPQKGDFERIRQA